MTGVLFGITLLAAVGVGGVHIITNEPIAMAELAAKEQALKCVLPEFENTEATNLDIDNLPIVVYEARKGGQVVGYAVESATKAGFGGMINLMVGFTAEGEVLNINVLKQSETPGLGTKMTLEDNPLIRSIKGRTPSGELMVKKDGGDVDALTAATISSRAYVDAVNRAFKAYKSVKGETSVAPAASETEEPAAQEGVKNE